MRLSAGQQCMSDTFASNAHAFILSERKIGMTYMLAWQVIYDLIHVDAPPGVVSLLITSITHDSASILLGAVLKLLQTSLPQAKVRERRERSVRIILNGREFAVYAARLEHWFLTLQGLPNLRSYVDHAGVLNTTHLAQLARSSTLFRAVHSADLFNRLSAEVNSSNWVNPLATECPDVRFFIYAAGKLHHSHCIKIL